MGLSPRRALMVSHVIPRQLQTQTHGLQHWPLKVDILFFQVEISCLHLTVAAFWCQSIILCIEIWLPLFWSFLNDWRLILAMGCSDKSSQFIDRWPGRTSWVQWSIAVPFRDPLYKSRGRTSRGPSPLQIQMVQATNRNQNPTKIQQNWDQKLWIWSAMSCKVDGMPTPFPADCWPVGKQNDT